MTSNLYPPQPRVKMHWAIKYIGKAWEAGKEGPNTYDCWGLVRAVFRNELGIELPVVVLNPEELEGNVSAIKKAARVSGWRLLNRETDQPLEGDVLLMRNALGRHVGVYVTADRQTKVLHCSGGLTPKGDPYGLVLWQKLTELTFDGFHDFELWRKETTGSSEPVST